MHSGETKILDEVIVDDEDDEDDEDEKRIKIAVQMVIIREIFMIKNAELKLIREKLKKNLKRFRKLSLLW
jgi:hypothetical protein